MNFFAVGRHHFSENSVKLFEDHIEKKLFRCGSKDDNLSNDVIRVKKICFLH